MLNRWQKREDGDTTAALGETPRGEGERGARERKTFGNGVASLDACNQFRTARAVTISARSHVDARRR